MMKRLATMVLLTFGGCLAAVSSAHEAYADPPAICGQAGEPACAPGINPDIKCAWIAWATWTPCNMWIQVPENTPGSVSDIPGVTQ